MRRIIQTIAFLLMTGYALGANVTETDNFVFVQSAIFSNGASEIVKTTPSSTTSNKFGSYWSLDTEFWGTETNTLSASTWTNYNFITTAYSSFNLVRGRIFINANTNTIITTNYNVMFTYYDSPNSNSANMIYQSQMGLTYTLATNSAGTAQGATNIYVNDNSQLYPGALIWYGPISNEYVRIGSLPTTNNIILQNALANPHPASNSISRVREFGGGLCDTTRSYKFYYSIVATNGISIASNIVVVIEYIK